ncbi:tyrosine-type recombinase/integrase [Blastococcus saxobsidens]|uniref:Phage integrase family protein n=1 Tax=Blastococcus saxobsidens (strain DD2) TaxID=1146883 RepID=H6RNL2_BLASD|nr:site-specific integrase [Blastococcus saxobsidens]CCG05160.1 Phage integrase family protein [Blastococcus saxobsidens DD2]
MASIAKRPDGTFRPRYRDENGKEHARHFKRKVDAQRWLDEVTAAMVTGDYVDPAAGKITFKAWFAQWSGRQVWERGTTLAARQAADSVTFADVPMRQIRPSHVQQWVKAMSQPARGRKAGLAASTIRTRYNYVHMAMRAAVVDRIIKSDPSAGVPLPRARRASASMTIPAVDEVGRALSAAPEWFQPFIAVCAFAGLRLGETAGLRLEDVDFLRRTISVRRQLQGENSATTQPVAPKFGSERVVYAPAELMALLAKHAERPGVQREDWLFTNAGQPLNRNSAGHQWRQVRKASGLDGYTLHDLRHFYASGLIASGCDVVTVQRALGHSSATITLGVYSHLWPTAEDRTRAAAGDLMAAALGASADSLRTGRP